MNKFFTIIIYSILFISCTKNGMLYEKPVEVQKKSDDTVPITTTRSMGNILYGDNLPKTRAMDNYEEDPFTKVRQIQCFESVVLPELQPHIWIGNILTKSSIVNCTYKPLIYPKSYITLSLTLPGTSSKTLEKLSYSKYLSYIKEQTSKGTYLQNSEFSFSIEQFTSYNELKVAFGSNANTNSIFTKSSNSTSSENYTIKKATGLYVKFYQTSFKSIMDYPEEQIASIPNNLIDSAVYINSITYGRLGILTIETNQDVSTSKTYINNIFRTIFSNNSEHFSKEEQNFLDGCEFKIYMIGGNSITSVESFTGLYGFLQHIKKGSFNKYEPGVPIFMTFNHVKDNSPVSVNFSISVKRDPLYVEMDIKPTGRNIGDLYLYFYRNRSKIPTIAHPAIKFKINDYSTLREYTDSKVYESNNEVTTYQNTGYQTAIKIKSDVFLRDFLYNPNDTDIPEFLNKGLVVTHEYTLLESLDNLYKIIGKNPINDENTNIYYN